MVMGKCNVYVNEHMLPGSKQGREGLHVVCGWIVPHSLVGVLRNSLANAFHELNGKNHFHNRKGRKLLKQLIIQMLEMGCIPITSINEQQFVASAKLGRMLNDSIKTPVLHKLNVAVNEENTVLFADMLVKKCSEEVQEFLQLSKNPDKQKLKVLFKTFRQKLLNERTMFAHLFSERVINLDELVTTLKQNKTLHPKKAASLSKTPIFTPLISSLETFGRKNEVKLHIYGNETTPMMDHFRTFSAGSLTHVKYRGMVKGDKEPLMKMSEVLSSLMNSLFSYDYTGGEDRDLSLIGYLVMKYSMKYQMLINLMDMNKFSVHVREWRQTNGAQIVN
ncbi:hypothetical protein [Neobacillus niacini]|uniref:hypothetical protein n=1 Tax=Neobacillus niacini TaxID=86668 RepID=UPI0021CB96AD|nr:hypothetical protein [Neobacillus niacini]MCM3764400.1 hypothetical protein [Neobacillus niacini]